MLTDFGQVQKTLRLKSKSAFKKYVHMDASSQSLLPLLLPPCLQGESNQAGQGHNSSTHSTAWSGQVNFNPLESVIPPNPSGLKPRRNEQALLCKEVVRGARERHRRSPVV